jgi:hypothetical protein
MRFDFSLGTDLDQSEAIKAALLPMTSDVTQVKEYSARNEQKTVDPAPSTASEHVLDYWIGTGTLPTHVRHTS